MKVKLFLDNKTKEIYHEGYAQCDFCHTSLISVFINICFSKKTKKISLSCFKCIPKLKNYGTVANSFLTAICKFDIMPEYVPYAITRPSLTYGSSISPYIHSCEVIDYARYAGREFPAIDFEKNKHLLAQREEDLGDSS